MSASDYTPLGEQFGLVSAIALVVGTAIGLSIFVIPTQMAAITGPSITIALLLSFIPMLLAVLMLMQLGGSIPVAGGAYVYGSRLVGPFWGMVGLTCVVLSTWAYLLYGAYGFAQYLTGIIGDIVPELAIIWALLGGILLLNYASTNLALKAQVVGVVALCGGILVFVFSGLSAVDTANYTPLFPDELFAGGLGPFVLAAIFLYIPFQGFNVITEIGEEIKDPVRNLPRALLLGMGIVVTLTLAMVFVLVGAVPWEAMVNPETGEAYEAGLVAVADGILTDAGLLVVAIAALIAVITTVNTLITAQSRTVMRAARDEIIPGRLAEINDRFNTPSAAVVLLAGPPLLLAPVIPYLDGTLLSHVGILDWLVVVVITGLFIGFMTTGVALWNLPKIYPEQYRNSVYTLPLPVLQAVAIGNVLTSILFIIAIAGNAPTALGTVFFAILVTAAIYLRRVRGYDDEDIDLKARMAFLHSHEEPGTVASTADD